MSDPEPRRRRYTERALAGHAAMLARFERGDGMLRRDGRVHLPGVVAHLWPFARALVATLDVAELDPGTHDLETTIARRLAALEHYWDDRGPAYASDPPGGIGGRLGGDIYYDDNAWAGLALVQLARQRPGLAPLQRAAQLADFACAGWSTDAGSPSPGGVFWVQQGRGAGDRNHDRNTVSTAPNAALILHLRKLGVSVTASSPTPRQMAEWVVEALDAGGDGGGLYWDKLTGEGTIDRARWSYNQGSMIGLGALLYDAGEEGWLARAQTTARRALDHYGHSGYAGEPAEFVAIFMRNLLILSAATRDEALRARIDEALRERADATWPVAPGATLLAHSAVVSLQALAAWPPEAYRRLA